MRAAAGAAVALLLAACHAGTDRVVEQRLLAMGTWVDIAIRTDDAPRAGAAIGEAGRLLRGFGRNYYPWADGELAQVNEAIGAGRAARVDPGLASLLEKAQQLSARSGGAFDPGVGALVQLWGFNDAANPPDAPPDRAAIAAWLKDPASIAALRVDGDRVSASRRTLLIDLGGIAKGEAVDRIVRLLTDAGFDDVLVNAGGDLRAVGRRAGRGWRVGIKAPRGPGLLGVVELDSGEAAFSSGDYERYYDFHGKRMHHILDPATGYPVDHTRAVTVIAADGVTADAAATAVFVAGPDRWQQVARALGVKLVLRVDASGRIQMTREMRERLQEAEDLDSDIIVVNS
jgi:thiamine biosynthesis lipoprotein